MPGTQQGFCLLCSLRMFLSEIRADNEERTQIYTVSVTTALFTSASSNGEIFSYASLSPAVCIVKAVLSLFSSFLLLFIALPPSCITHIKVFWAAKFKHTWLYTSAPGKSGVCVSGLTGLFVKWLLQGSAWMCYPENERQLYSGFLETSTEVRLSDRKND